MSSGTRVSVQGYLRRTEKPNAEYIDGVVCPKPMPTIPHSLIQAMLILCWDNREYALFQS